MCLQQAVHVRVQVGAARAVEALCVEMQDQVTAVVQLDADEARPIVAQATLELLAQLGLPTGEGSLLIACIAAREERACNRLGRALHRVCLLRLVPALEWIDRVAEALEGARLPWCLWQRGVLEHGPRR